MKREAQIYMDIDRDRIRDLVDLAYGVTCETTKQETLHRTRESIMEELEKYLSSSLVSVPVHLDFSSPRMTDFRMRVDFRRREVLGVTARFVALKNQINAVLRTA